MLKTIKKSWPALYVGLAFVSAFVLTGAGTTTDEDGPKKTEFKAAKGYSIILSGNWQGQIEPCGCTEHQKGGLDRRTETINTIAPDADSRLILEAGPLIDDFDRQNQLKFDTFLRAMKTVGYDAVAMSAPELKLLHDHIVDLEPQFRPEVICTNMPQKQLDKFAGAKFFTKQLKYDGKTLDSYVFGLTDKTDSEETEELGLTDPMEALNSQLSDLKISDKKDALVVVLTRTDNDSLIEKLKATKDVDMVICLGFGDEPEVKHRTGDTALIADTGSLSKYIARFVVSPEKNAGPDNLKLDAVPIHSSFNQDPAIVTLMDQYQMSMKVENLISDQIERMGLEDDNMFVGSASCGDGPDCHGDIYDIWKGLKHSQAVPTLEAVNRDFDPECMECHTVGLRYESGFKSKEETPELAAVGCEMCHGPGMFHNEYPSEPYRVIFTNCEECHNDYHSPEFKEKREEYFQKIKHWEGEREYWD